MMRRRLSLLAVLLAPCGCASDGPQVECGGPPHVPIVAFTVTTVTGEEATDMDVSFCIVRRSSSTSECYDLDGPANNFESGQTDVFAVGVPWVRPGDLDQISIYAAGGAIFDMSWDLAALTVEATLSTNETVVLYRNPNVDTNLVAHASFVATGCSWAGPFDEDGDGVPGYAYDVTCSGGVASDCNDNCPQTANPNQEDADIDGIGDACDPTGFENNNLNAHLWSPDGTRVAFTRCPEGRSAGCSIITADASFGDLQLVTVGTTATDLADWQGDWILFLRSRSEGTPAVYDGDGEYWKVHPDGTGLTQVTFTQTDGIRTTVHNSSYTNRGTARWAAFVPGGGLIYFLAHDGNGWYQTYTCNDDGSDGWKPISGAYGWAAAVSPTGTRVLYATGSNYDKQMTITAADPDGANPVQLVLNVTPPLEMAVSPDGTMLAYVAGASGDRHVRIVGLDGNSDHALTAGTASESLRGLDQGAGVQLPVANGNPWSPDSQWLLFGSDAAAEFHIFRAHSDGTAATQVSTGAFFDFAPSYSPDGTHIAYHRVAPDLLGSVPLATELVIAPAP